MAINPDIRDNARGFHSGSNNPRSILDSNNITKVSRSILMDNQAKARLPRTLFDAVSPEFTDSYQWTLGEQIESQKGNPTDFGVKDTEVMETSHTTVHCEQYWTRQRYGKAELSLQNTNALARIREGMTMAAARAMDLVTIDGLFHSSMLGRYTNITANLKGGTSTTNYPVLGNRLFSQVNKAFESKNVPMGSRNLLVPFYAVYDQLWEDEALVNRDFIAQAEQRMLEGGTNMISMRGLNIIMIPNYNIKERKVRGLQLKYDGLPKVAATNTRQAGVNCIAFSKDDIGLVHKPDPDGLMHNYSPDTRTWILDYGWFLGVRAKRPENVLTFTIQGDTGEAADYQTLAGTQ